MSMIYMPGIDRLQCPHTIDNRGHSAIHALRIIMLTSFEDHAIRMFLGSIEIIDCSSFQSRSNPENNRNVQSFGQGEAHIIFGCNRKNSSGGCGGMKVQDKCK